VGSGVEPQPKLNLLNFSVKYDIRWEQFYLFCKELADQIQCSLSNKSKKHGGTTNLKMGQQVICKQSEQKKLEHCRKLSHFVLCIFQYFRQFAIKQIFPTVYNFLLPPTFSRRHLPPLVNGIEWTPLLCASERILKIDQ